MLEVAICVAEKTVAERVFRHVMTGHFDACCDMFSNGWELLENSGAYDIIFLDYKVYGADDRAMLCRLREIYGNSLIIFLADDSAPAPDVFQIRPFRYLLKNMAEEKLRGEVREIMEAGRSRKAVSFLYAKRGSDIIRVPVIAVSYIEIARHGCVLHSLEGGGSRDYTTKSSIRELDHMLRESGFVRAHNSYLVNLEHIVTYEKTYVRLDDGGELNISRAYQKKFSLTVQKFLQNRT